MCANSNLAVMVLNSVLFDKNPVKTDCLLPQQLLHHAVLFSHRQLVVVIVDGVLPFTVHGVGQHDEFAAEVVA